MNPSPSCPLCHSPDVGEYGNDGSAVLWCICYRVRTSGCERSAPTRSTQPDPRSAVALALRICPAARCPTSSRENWMTPWLP